MQKEILKWHNLLDENGNLTQPGYSKKILAEFHRSKVKANHLRIKEWDYYLIYNGDYGVALTMDDNSYMGLMSISLLDFKQREEITQSFIHLMPKGKMNFPKSSKNGSVHYVDKKCSFTFHLDQGIRTLDATMGNFKEHKPIKVHFVLTDEPQESMVIATPFDKPKHFYYNQKITNMKANGFVEFDGKKIYFKDDTTTGILDWGRGVWTYDNTWYWGCGSGFVEGKAFGFNLGYGFGNTENATENMLFYEGKAHKLENVNFEIPMKEGKEDYLKPWKFTSSDQRFEMDFNPILDRAACTSLGVILSDQHQVFGTFSGRAVLDDGKVIQLDQFLGFAEKVHNKW